MLAKSIKVLYCDIGGVLLTNGWDHNSRTQAAEKFNFDFKSMNSRHQMIFGDYEVGKITLDEYLHYAVFYEPRQFSPEDFKKFMFAQSKPDENMLKYVRELKQRHGFKVVFVSNEGRELTDYRVAKFKLHDIADFFLISCFIGIRKPDKQVFRMALDLVQVPPEQTAYLDDREMFIEIASAMGINAIHHVDITSTQHALAQLGLK